MQREPHISSTEIYTKYKKSTGPQCGDWSKLEADNS